MSSLSIKDKQVLEASLGMGSGFVLDLSDQTFAELVNEVVKLDIHADEYRRRGSSKANKLRTFWELESDYLVGRLLNALIDYAEESARDTTGEGRKRLEICRAIASRLLAVRPSLDDLKKQMQVLDAIHLAEQIRRMEDSVETDPSLAIGTAKELIETCCKTILAERGKEVSGTADIPSLTKATLKELAHVPEGVPSSAKGAEVIKRILSNLSTIGHGLAELRGLYGSGHGKHASTSSLDSRHARLAVGTASTLAVFLFETHKQRP